MKTTESLISLFEAGKAICELFIAIFKWIIQGIIATIQGIVNGLLFIFRISFGLSILAFSIFIALLIIIKVIKFVWFF